MGLVLTEAGNLVLTKKLSRRSMSAESVAVPKVEEYLAGRGWEVSREVKVR